MARCRRGCASITRTEVFMGSRRWMRGPSSDSSRLLPPCEGLASKTARASVRWRRCAPTWGSGRMSKRSCGERLVCSRPALSLFGLVAGEVVQIAQHFFVVDAAGAQVGGGATCESGVADGAHRLLDRLERIFAERDVHFEDLQGGIEPRCAARLVGQPQCEA